MRPLDEKAHNWLTCSWLPRTSACPATACWTSTWVLVSGCYPQQRPDPFFLSYLSLEVVAGSLAWIRFFPAPSHFWSPRTKQSGFPGRSHLSSPWSVPQLLLFLVTSGMSWRGLWCLSLPIYTVFWDLFGPQSTSFHLLPSSPTRSPSGAWRPISAKPFPKAIIVCSLPGFCWSLKYISFQYKLSNDRFHCGGFNVE